MFFILLYGAALASAALVFDVRWPGMFGTLYLVIFYALSVFAILAGACVNIRSRRNVRANTSGSSLDALFDWLLLIAVSNVVYGWILLLSHYGGILAILADAFDIRQSSIGGQDSVVPPLVTYAFSPIYAVWVYELARKECTGEMRRVRLGLAFISIVLIDLMTFGRVGILFSLMSALAWYASKPRRVRLRGFVLILCILSVSMVPRLLRGNFDNFEGSMERYRPALRMQTPELLNPAVALLPYYAGGFFSAGQLIESFESSDLPDGGIRTFTPLVNAFNRLFSVSRITNIDVVVEVPFEHNVHGMPWDLLRDFGVYGFFPATLLLGLALGAASRDSSSRLGLATIYFVGAVVFFFPVYSLVSFGSFFLALGLLLLLRFQRWACK